MKRENPIKPDILKIEKNAKREIVHHYNRNERLSMPSAPKLNYGRRGIFKNNRSLIILLLDVILVIVITYVATRFFMGPSFKGKVEGYNFYLNGFIFSDMVYVTLDISTGEANKSEVEVNKVKVVFYLDNNKKDKFVFERKLPLGSDKKVTIRTQIPFSGETVTVYAKISVGKTDLLLSRKAKR